VKSRSVIFGFNSSSLPHSIRIRIAFIKAIKSVIKKNNRDTRIIEEEVGAPGRWSFFEVQAIVLLLFVGLPTKKDSALQYNIPEWCNQEEQAQHITMTWLLGLW
jgi:hypothetical protein